MRSRIPSLSRNTSAMSREPTVKGRVLEAHPNTQFTVELETGKVVLCYLSGRMKNNHIFVIVGDKVEVFIPEQGDIARITHRFK